ncbi:hypothetical protein PLICRDRAFT_47367 [Plicaturopsis crispa FD-325 SS-3]|uniref:Uncharacterized protein n=1 Tax=Plicaturopsis crispa FD-325 SS-3 TaxID=944288 RepID=A0A0C9SQ46_PLICR|nr:hypothetical protein PLICRDRAFT_47367 [Plicaturopsis crispa FD-325 SS-3]
MNSVPEITIQPPSRSPSSGQSAHTPNTRPNFLSAADADRPVPLPSPRNEAPLPPTPSQHPPAPTPMQHPPTPSPHPPTTGPAPIALPSGGLPPGFVASPSPNNL